MTMFYRSLSTLVAITALFGATSSASAADYEFCIVYHAQTIDSGIGEDHYVANTWWKSRGARTRVRRVDTGANVFQGYASLVNGCFTFSSDASQFYVDIFSQTRLGATNNITVNAFDANGDLPHWTVLTSDRLSPGRHYYYNQASHASNLIAIGSFITHWVDSHSGTPVTASHTMTLHDRDCLTIPGNSCNDDYDHVSIQPDGNQRKFLIGHEVGHNLYAMHRDDGTFGDFDCTLNSGGAACTYSTGISTNEHALHSKEYASCALSEGFAHFAAVDAFNDHDQTDGFFHYYKPNYPTIVNAQNGATGGSTAFMEASCSGTDDGHGVELDWMRAFWNYRTDAGAEPSTAQIMSQIEAAHDDGSFTPTTAYDRLLETATDDGFGDRLEEIWQEQGADH
jgi:hypothetical protein